MESLGTSSPISPDDGKSPQQRVTINDLARSLGLSKSTVSRALNGYSDISESTILRVRNAAKSTGYRPLSHAQAIRTGRVRALALVLQLGDHDAQSPFLQDFLAGITLATGSEGWTLTVATATSEANMAEVLQRLVQERKADGFILPRTTVDDPRVTLLRALNMPMVLFGRTGFGRPDPGPDLSWYDVSGEQAMQDAVLRLADLGHSRIAYVGGDLRYNYSGLRRQGYRDGLAHVGLKHDPEIELANAHSPGDGTRATRHLLSLNAPPTAIVFATDAAAMGAYRAAQDTGLRIGQHLSIIGYDGIPTGEYADPGLTTFSVDSQTAGERLATLLIRQIRGDNPTDLQELARATLVVRGSDGAPALQSADLAKFIQK